jgi:hypothetical protein
MPLKSLSNSCQFVPASVVLSCLWLVACGHDQPPPEEPAQIGGAGGQSAGAGGTNGSAGAAGRGGTAGGVLGGTGAILDFGGVGGGFVCPNPPASQHASGIATAVLDDEPPRFTQALALVREGDGVVFADALRSRPGGLIVLGHATFWDVALGGALRSYETQALQIVDAIAADFDADGDDDLALLEHLDDGPESVRFALSVWERGASGLEPRVELHSLNSDASAHARGDLDGDGDLDVVTFERGEVVVHRNEGGFTFSRVASSELAATYETSWVTRAVLLEDRNGDERADLVALVQHDVEMHVLTFFGEASGRFALPMAQLVGDFAQRWSEVSEVVRGDVTGDGRADFVVRADDVRVIAGSDPESSVRAERIFDPISHLQVIDVDGDGALDIAGRTPMHVQLLVSDGQGGFEPQVVEVTTYDMVDFEITRQADEARLNALYRMDCPRACDESCGSCRLEACVACLSHTDCTTGVCERHVCTTGEPVHEDEDGGAP